MGMFLKFMNRPKPDFRQSFFRANYFIMNFGTLQGIIQMIILQNWFYSKNLWLIILMLMDDWGKRPNQKRRNIIILSFIKNKSIFTFWISIISLDHLTHYRDAIACELIEFGWKVQVIVPNNNKTVAKFTLKIISRKKSGNETLASFGPVFSRVQECHWFPKHLFWKYSWAESPFI